MASLRLGGRYVAVDALMESTERGFAVVIQIDPASRCVLSVSDELPSEKGLVVVVGGVGCSEPGGKLATETGLRWLATYVEDEPFVAVFCGTKVHVGKSVTVALGPAAFAKGWMPFQPRIVPALLKAAAEKPDAAFTLLSCVNATLTQTTAPLFWPPDHCDTAMRVVDGNVLSENSNAVDFSAGIKFLLFSGFRIFVFSDFRIFFFVSK